MPVSSGYSVEGVRGRLDAISLNRQDSDASKSRVSPVDNLLWDSVESAASFPGMLRLDVAKSVAGPRQLKGDKAAKFQYWFNESLDTPFTVEFVALLDLECDKAKQMYGRTGPYFNLHPDAQRYPITEKDLLTKKVIFSLSFLPENSDKYPQNAIDNSKLTRNFLNLAYLNAESQVHHKDNEERLPAVTPFIRTDETGNSWRLPVQSKPIFYPPEVSVIKKDFSLESLDDEELMSAISTPTGLKRYLSSPVRNPRGTVTLADMPDPERRYSDFMNEDPRNGSIRVEAPPVYDEQGDLIHPRDYQHKLKHMAPVHVKAVMRLFTIKRPGADKDASCYSTTTMPTFERRAVFGSRNYQMILTEMKFLPTTSGYMPQLERGGDTDVESEYEGDDDAGYHTPE